MQAAPAHPSPPTLHSAEQAAAYRRHVRRAAGVDVTPDHHRYPPPGSPHPSECAPEPVPVGR